MKSFFFTYTLSLSFLALSFTVSLSLSLSFTLSLAFYFLLPLSFFLPLSFSFSLSFSIFHFFLSDFFPFSLSIDINSYLFFPLSVSIILGTSSAQLSAYGSRPRSGHCISQRPTTETNYFCGIHDIRVDDWLKC